MYVCVCVGLTGVELERLLALESQFHLLREVVALLENHQRVLRLGFCGRAWGNKGCSKNNLNAFCFHRLNKKKRRRRMPKQKSAHQINLMRSGKASQMNRFVL